MVILTYILVAFAAYLIGSIPTGYLVARAKGVDIRSVGSGNIGATNVFRILGKGPGMFVLGMDAFKGWVGCGVLPVMIESMMRNHAPGAHPRNEVLIVLGGVCSILGHNYTCWLNFKGGKGIATSAGVLIAMIPMAFVISFSTWGIVLAISRYVSLASVAAAAILPFAAWWAGSSPLMIAMASLMGGLAIYKHKANIRRLLNGTENRVGEKKPVESTDTNS
ncbi:MAG TPA: glycerol-3-phosphate 1-O-acyltransferase PlsY [Roseimicrobium sp.]|nr:glycerol-3-phosphate 1-O-acyltransferase PlsY [Roseimicrobium sp.]